MHDYEARDIETALGIPSGWMDEEGWVEHGWKLIEMYRTLDSATQAFTNNLVAFLRTQQPRNISLRSTPGRLVTELQP